MMSADYRSISLYRGGVGLWRLIAKTDCVTFSPILRAGLRLFLACPVTGTRVASLCSARSCVRT